MMANKKKWTLIDTLIVILVIAAGVVGCRMFSTKTVGGDSKKIEVEVLIANQDESLADALHIGDEVTVSLTEKDSGILRNFRAEQAETMVYDSINGEYNNVPVENRIDIYATVELDVKESDYAFRAGSTIIQVGTDLPFRGKGFASKGFVITINEEVE